MLLVLSVLRCPDTAVPETRRVARAMMATSVPERSVARVRL